MSELFTRDDLKALNNLAERVQADAEWYGARLVVEVWAANDSGPIAWIEHYPEDSDPKIQFEDPDGDES